MNGFVNFIKDNFSAFLEWMLFIPSEIQIQSVDVGEAAVLVLILVLPLGVIFLCDWLMKKHKPGFVGGVLLTFLVLSLTLGLTGFLLSIPRLSSSVYDTFPLLCIGSPVFNLIPSVIVSFGSRLRNHHPIAGILLLLGAGLSFAYIFFTTFIVFLWPLINN